MPSANWEPARLGNGGAILISRPKVAVQALGLDDGPATFGAKQGEMSKKLDESQTAARWN